MKNVVIAAGLCAAVLLLGSCRSDPEISTDASFIDVKYEVPEISSGSLAKPTDGRLVNFWSFTSPSGTAVLTNSVYKVSGAPVGCCYSVRLTNLDETGGPRSQKILVSQTPGTNFFKVFPLQVDSNAVKLAVIEVTWKRLNPGDRQKTPIRKLWLADFSREGDQEHRPPAIELPNDVTVGSVWSRADGLTVIIGTKRISGKTAGWIGQLSKDHAWGWQRTYKNWNRGWAHQHEFTTDGTLVLHERASRMTDYGAENTLSQRTIELSTGNMSEKSMLSFPRSDLSNSLLGKIRPVTEHAVRLPGGDSVITMNGWYRGKFERLRVARISGDGKILWIKRLIEGLGRESPELAVGIDGEIVVTGHTDDNQYLFRVSMNGTLIAKHPVRGIRIREIIPHPNGGYLAWAIGKVGDRRQKMTLLRIKRWPPD